MVWVMLLSPFSVPKQRRGSKGDTKEEEEKRRLKDGHGVHHMFYSSQPAT